MVSPRRSFILVLLAALCCAAPAWAKRATYIRPVMKSVSTAGLTQVVIQNLVGPIDIITQPTDQVKIAILVHGGGLDRVFARTLTQQLHFDIRKIGPQLRIIGHYPVKQFQNYGYPYMKSFFFIHGTDTNIYRGHRVHIRDVGNKKSVELWAEIRVTLPSSLSLVIRNIYGDVRMRGNGGGGNGSLDGFTDVGDFLIHNPRWAQVKLDSDYGSIKFLDGFGVVQDMHVKTDFGGTYFYLRPGASGKIIAHKTLGFLHNNFNDALFKSDGDGHKVMVLGDGRGTTVHVDMNVGSLHLEKAP